MDSHKNTIKFLGTGGARFVVSRQLRHSGGIWCCFNGKNILIDPGPGTLLRCLASRPRLNPESLDTIILTHRHLDHSCDANIMIEAMTGGRVRKKGIILAPSDALSGHEPVVFGYLQEAVEKVEMLRAGSTYTIGEEVKLITPLRHRHSVETYGLKFILGEKEVSFIADTAFCHDIVEQYDTDIIILNVVLYEHPVHSTIEHLDYKDCRKIIEIIRPKMAVITHFGLTMLKKKPWKLAEQLSLETGVQVIAAHDGMNLNI
ncbi:MBL fold metallo-hydrolase [Candidatus Contubernalis alkaliaceticus]|uniref:MBL fold metallo-hydrolase n=1 Tax=Candidatus Contubernalis alkaliaceticus TaxID=338645 RepID=UPI001F4C0F37|nr:MBL fold metallo-hydrolase [Candidatus Contubernalis alkalaceticus]UNC92077.1 MBL fold metallo-hydrolase [Candidatus Contubernalis alkalaceticus]